MKVLSFPHLLADWLRTTHSANPRRLRLAFFALLAAIVVLMSVKYAIKISKPGDGGQQSRSAFLRWRSLVNGVFAGENIYVGLNEYPNPPIMAVLLRPFAALPPAVGAMAWFYAKVLLAEVICASTLQRAPRSSSACRRCSATCRTTTSTSSSCSSSPDASRPSAAASTRSRG